MENENSLIMPSPTSGAGRASAFLHHMTGCECRMAQLVDISIRKQNIPAPLILFL
ncbi:Hypothetical protein GbCGDNIH3_5076 [Granulibacter bethesdensis]|uniref:Uncharacterized protein n=1 Tax=Granulibacter bethesdensis TaxID=364410 RepID=A0AAN0VFZ7_9PROT|nr:Hypothetical protein GbCGDNIH3_5076 [Granulibacter bethesdensis]AHJ66100.1 Hypothetical protein GbCGDNIH4_5076 [Granulibacter bethesdensis CGDNIH4]APH59780.1 Hypothetical protein GbCGDNIH7_5076 [Granulibacter bethesdensis]